MISVSRKHKVTYAINNMNPCVGADAYISPTKNVKTRGDVGIAPYKSNTPLQLSNS